MRKCSFFYVVYLNGDRAGIFDNKKLALEFCNYLDFYNIDNLDIVCRKELL